jgi:plastocyanin
MRLPRIVFAAPLLAAGALLPTLGAEPAKPPTGAIGMRHEAFATREVTVPCGAKLTVVNNSRWVHIIGPGRDGQLVATAGVPVVHRQLLETGDSYTTGPWRTPGIHYLTCSVHPEMTVKVVVTGCCCPHRP